MVIKQPRDAAMAAPRVVCMGWGTRLLDDNLSAINDIDALESLGVSHLTSLQVVDFMLFFDDRLLNTHLLVGEGYDVTETAPGRGGLIGVECTCRHM